MIVVASLSAIAAIVFLLFENQRDSRLAEIRSHGVSLARTLSGVPYDQLVPGGEQQGVVQVIRHGINDGSFAYASVVDREGIAVTAAVAAGLIVPAATMPDEPAAWLGELEFELSSDGRKIIEFHAPLLDRGNLQGFVRLGFFYPESGFELVQLPFLAMVAMPVFLLAPLFYFLLRREVRPIRAANREFTKLIEGESFRRLEIAATGELGEFMQGFNKFVEFAGAKIAALEQDQAQMLTSSKLLSYRKNRVEIVLETLPEAVMVLDETGAVTFANEKLAAMFGATREDVLSKPPQQWCENPDVLDLLAKFQSGSKGRNLTDTLRFNAGAMSKTSIATKTYPLFLPKNPSSTIGTLIAFRDETQEAFARQARSDFVAHLSHELKSPLHVLGLYSEALLGKEGNSEEFRVEAANVISSEVQRMSSLITSLLSMTQIESGSITPERSLVKLGEVARAAFDEARQMATGEDYTFEFDVPKEMNPIFVDKDLIRIAITNLLSNAVKYNQDGGSIRIAIEETEDAIQIRVADSGIGISETEAEKVFEKFYRSDDERVRSAGGHGLGLALAKQIVELHHGTLSLNRDRAEGSEFIINFWKESMEVKQAI